MFKFKQNMKRIITGLTATNNLTLGNYLGAILPLKRMNEDPENEIFLFVADYHAISQNIEKESLKNNIKSLLKVFLACEFDLKRVKIFIQSEINGHTDLMFLFTGITYIGELSRMTQFKDKSNSQENKQDNGTSNIPSSLLFYPVLMSADILIYKSDSVIVGEDQKQHLELTRNIAKRFNKKYGNTFPIPEPIIGSDSGKIMSLKNPEIKMSKSDKNEDATIFLIDTPDNIRNKINKSLTDGENKIYIDQKNKPGIYNLLKIYANLKNISINEVANKFIEYNYSDFKKEIGNLVISEIEKIQKNLNEIDDMMISNILEKNRNEIQNIAKNNLEEIKNKMGF